MMLETAQPAPIAYSKSLQKQIKGYNGAFHGWLDGDAIHPAPELENFSIYCSSWAPIDRLSS